MHHPTSPAHDRGHERPPFRVEDPAGLHPHGYETDKIPRSVAGHGDQDLRRFQLHLTENRAGAPIINSTVSALRFFFTVTLGRADAARHLTFVHDQAAGRPEPRGGRPPGGARRQVQGRAQRRLWRRPARLLGRLAKSLGYRQQAHDAARRAGQQGRQELSQLVGVVGATGGREFSRRMVSERAFQRAPARR
jgi:hypothetical protein